MEQEEGYKPGALKAHMERRYTKASTEPPVRNLEEEATAERTLSASLAEVDAAFKPGDLKAHMQRRYVK